MPNIGATIKEEIVRLSRKVQKQGVASLQKASTTYRRDIASLKREVQSLRRELERTKKGLTIKAAAPAKAEVDEGPTPRFQVRGLKSLRARLDLSAADFGTLVGVSGQTIYNWEAEKASPRRGQLGGLAALRGIGKKEARARLAQLAK